MEKLQDEESSQRRTFKMKKLQNGETSWVIFSPNHQY